MLSKFLLIALFVAMCSRSSENLKIAPCNNDQDCAKILSRLNKDTMPILVTDNADQSVDDQIRYALSCSGFTHMVQVNVEFGRCGITDNYLQRDNKQYPSLLFMNDCHLVYGKMAGFDTDKFDQLLRDAKDGESQKFKDNVGHSITDAVALEEKRRMRIQMGLSGDNSRVFPYFGSHLPLALKKKWGLGIGIDLTHDGPFKKQRRNIINQ